MVVNVSGIVKESIVDGPGIRYTVFVQGCPHRCDGCHNPQTHPFEGGEQKMVSELYEDINKNPLLKGVTFSGGEPFCQAEALSELARLVNEAGKDVVTYSGYTFEKLIDGTIPFAKELLFQTKLLIDGPFVKEQRDLMLKFRGSKNQRLIDVKKSLETGRAVEIEE